MCYLLCIYAISPLFCSMQYTELFPTASFFVVGEYIFIAMFNVAHVGPNGLAVLGVWEE